MGFLWHTALKDLRRHRRNPAAFILWLGIPLIIGTLIILMTGGDQGPRPQAHLLVADLDDSFLSGLLTGALSQESAGGGFVRAERVEEAAGLELMDQGKATALLVIPDGFGGAMLREEPVTLRLVTNPAQRILPDIVSEMLSMFADATFYLHRLVGDELRAMAAGPPPGAASFADSTIAGFSTRINRIAAQITGRLDPLAIRLLSGPLPGETPPAPLNLGAVMLAGILFMSLLFIAQDMGNEMWQEHDNNTLRRVLVTPQSMLAFLLGKALAMALIIAAVSLLGLALGYAYLGQSPATLPLALLWATVSGVALAGMMLFLQLLMRSQRAGNILTLTLTFPLMMLGGSFFPFEAMEGWMVAIGRLTPNGWMLVRFKSVLMAERGALSLLPDFLGLAAGLVLVFALCAWRLRARFARG